jgi:hypothetical protein
MGCGSPAVVCGSFLSTWQGELVFGLRCGLLVCMWLVMKVMEDPQIIEILVSLGFGVSYTEHKESKT